MVDLEDLQKRIQSLPAADAMKSGKEYVSLGRIGYGGGGPVSKKPKFDPSAGRDYDADADALADPDR
jgi:hypothetical protein